MSPTPAFALLGLALILLAIPLAFSLGPFVIGIIMIVWAGRRAHLSLAETDAYAPGPAAATAASTPSA
jgi:hypothetical protein